MVDVRQPAGPGPDRLRAVPVADLITHRLPLEQAIEGLHTAAGGEAIKVTIEPTGEVGRSESG